MTRTTPDPVPITVTETAVNLRTGRVETWAARSDSGGEPWVFVRIEEPGTPCWYAEAADLRLSATFTSLRAARVAAADGLRQVLIGNARLDAARRGLLLSTLAQSRYLCECGAPLGDVGYFYGQEQYRHIDGCNNCVEEYKTSVSAWPDTHRRTLATPPLAAPECDSPELHVICSEPRPRLCLSCGKFPMLTWTDCGHDGGCCGDCCNRQPECIDYDR